MIVSTSLYRYFDSKGRLLYVGISVSALDRMRAHIELSAWFREVASMTVVKYETAAEAKVAEKEAIQKEHPLHNVVFNGGRGHLRRAARNGDTEIEKRIEKARQAVRERVGEQARIAREVGVSYQWLRQFASGVLKEPGAVKFAHLEEWLAKN